MIGLIICLLLLFGIPTVIYLKNRDSYDASFFATMAFLSTALVLMFLFYPLIGFTGGLGRNYSKGFAEGFLTNQSYSGLICKTHEYELQIGTGKQAALQKPARFSASNVSVVKQLSQLNGKKIRVYYNEWLIQPLQQGSSGYDVYKVEVLD